MENDRMMLFAIGGVAAIGIAALVVRSSSSTTGVDANSAKIAGSIVAANSAALNVEGSQRIAALNAGTSLQRDVLSQRSALTLTQLADAAAFDQKRIDVAGALTNATLSNQTSLDLNSANNAVTVQLAGDANQTAIEQSRLNTSAAFNLARINDAYQLEATRVLSAAGLAATQAQVAAAERASIVASGVAKDISNNQTTQMRINKPSWLQQLGTASTQVAAAFNGFSLPNFSGGSPVTGSPVTGSQPGPYAPAPGFGLVNP